MKKNPISQLLIRSAVARDVSLGNILACDPKKEEQEPHAMIFKWQAGAFAESSANFNAHSICYVTQPEPAVVFLAEGGEYGVHYKGGAYAGDILGGGQVVGKKKRTGGFRSVSEIGNHAYAVGYQGMVYRMEAISRWTRIDDGVPDAVDLDAIHGFGAADLYACGLKGACWHFNGKKWSRCDLPTDANLTSIQCAGDGKVYVGGDNGVLISGRVDTWKVLDHGETEEDIWDLEWFEDRLYVAADDGVFQLEKGVLVRVSFGKDKPKSFYQLSAAKGVMWSIGNADIMAFDGKRWARVV